MQLTPTVKEYKQILNGLDGYSEKDLKPFKDVSTINLDVSDKVFNKLELKMNHRMLKIIQLKAVMNNNEINNYF